MKLFITSFSALLILTSFTNWKTRYNEDGIVVKIRSEGIKRDIFASVEVDATIEKCLGLLGDVNKLKIFSYRANIVRLEGQAIPGQWMVYTTYDMPAPIKDRDAVTQYKVSRLANGDIEVNYESVSGVVPKSKDFKRQDDFFGVWKFEKVSITRTRVTYTAFGTTDGFPGWLVNMVITTGPRYTMTNFRKEVEK